MAWGWGPDREKPSAGGDLGNCEYCIPESLGRASGRPRLQGDSGRQQETAAYSGTDRVAGTLPPLLPIRVMAPESLAC